MSAPKRIWLDWPDANRGDVVYDEPPERDTQPGQTEYIRKDASDAAIAAARAEGVLEAAEFCHWNAVGLNPRLGYQVDPWTEEQGGKHPGHAYAKALRAKAEASK